ncbi:glutamate racemase [Candidatus Peregrinibacteria bacterium]|nr:glutamate racemase [Candidatus Peregrinibacteria bacterium]
MIAIFDSGYGGLTVMKPIINLLPQYDYIYLGDNARSPYGNHSPETIKKFAEEAVEYLFSKGAELIIFACNTASSTALRHVQHKYLKGKDEKDRKILGVLIPVAQQAVKITKNGKIGVVGTKATINSNVYETEIHKLNSKISIYQKACPLLVPFIEEGWHTKPEAKSVLKKYLRSLKDCHIDTLILGCTHYPLMIKDFKRIMGNKVKVLPSGEITAESLKAYLGRHPEIENKLSKNKKREFFTTDDPQKFQDFAEKNLGMKIKIPQKIIINNVNNE